MWNARWQCEPGAWRSRNQGKFQGTVIASLTPSSLCKWAPQNNEATTATPLQVSQTLKLMQLPKIWLCPKILMCLHWFYWRPVVLPSSMGSQVRQKPHFLLGTWYQPLKHSVSFWNIPSRFWTFNISSISCVGKYTVWLIKFI